MLHPYEVVFDEYIPRHVSWLRLINAAYFVFGPTPTKLLNFLSWNGEYSSSFAGTNFDSEKNSQSMHRESAFLGLAAETLESFVVTNLLVRNPDFMNSKLHTS